MTQDRRQLTPEAARLLTLSTDPWLSCEDCFDLMDLYVERLLDGPQTAEMRAMTVHLRGCAACAEEAESLLLLVAEQDGRDVHDIQRSLHD
ncbi:MAG TPA: hypothetical protein VK204_14145 [Nocardioidaceae bacterium]|nr:hypothetical protein [Nocardioidaceae bacterium]